MERRRGIKVLSIIALLIAVAGLTVAFAAMSRTLTINGTASMDAAKWDIHFENLRSETRGTGKIITPPTLQEDGTYIGDFEVTLSKPGDMVVFTVDVANAGDIDANLADIKINGFSMMNQSEEDNSKMLKSWFVEADWDGDGITTEEEKEKCLEQGLYFDGGPFEQHSIKAGEVFSDFVLGVMFMEEATELPKGEVTLNLNFQLIYEQA